MENSNNVNVCKKCGQVLPEGCKYKKCEGCRNKVIDRLKTGTKTAGGLFMAGLGAVLLFFGKKR